VSSYKIKKFLSDLRIGLALSILSFAKTNKFPRNLKILINNYRITSTFSNNNLSADTRFHSEAMNAYKEDHVGNLFEAKRIRIISNRESISSIKANQEFFPPFIGSRWTQFIGHLAVLALHSRAQSLGLVPEGKRYVLNAENVVNKSLFELFSENYFTLTNDYLAGLEFFPATAGLFESYHLIKTNSGPLETHEFIEAVFMNHESISKGESILSKNRVEESLSKESRLWLNSKIADEFVVIHLRNTGRNERRDVGVLEYLPALLELEKSGLQIVTIGPKLELNNMINVVHVADKSIQPYLFSKAKFAITSTSGPTLLPGLFGTPNLGTNMTALGRTMINCNESTFYLPKSVTFKGRIMTFREILDSNIAYDEQEHKDLAKLEYRMINNTEQELLLVIKWMLDKVEDGFSVSNTIDNNVRDIQDSMKAVSHGRLIPTYIETSKEFLD